MLEQKLKALLGEYAFQLVVLQHTNEELVKQIEDMKVKNEE